MPSTNQYPKRCAHCRRTVDNADPWFTVKIHGSAVGIDYAAWRHGSKPRFCGPLCLAEWALRTAQELRVFR